MQGHIHKRIHRCRDGRETVHWYVVVDVDRDADGRRRQKWLGGFRTRREAEVERARVVNELHSNRYVVPARLTLAEWVRDTWLPVIETRIKPTTFSRYRQMMESRVLPALGSHSIQKLRTRELDALYATLLRGDANGERLSASTVSNIHRAIHKALADAIDAGVLADNAASRAKAPRPWRTRSRRISSWRPSELAWFLDFVRRDRLAAIWRLIAMTGMRRGEVLALHWEDVDLARARLAVNRAFVEVDYRVLESTPKSGAARTIDLDAETVALLSAHRNVQRHERDEWGDAYRDRDLVAALEDGSQIRPSAFSSRFRALVEQAGLRIIRLHDLRHTHATLALQAGVPVTVISERLGHHSPSFTLAQYTHALPGMQAAAAASVADLIRSYRADTLASRSQVSALPETPPRLQSRPPHAKPS